MYACANTQLLVSYAIHIEIPFVPENSTGSTLRKSGSCKLKESGQVDATCSNICTDCQPELPAASANSYIEIASTSKLGEHTTHSWRWR